MDINYRNKALQQFFKSVKESWDQNFWELMTRIYMVNNKSIEERNNHLNT